MLSDIVVAIMMVIVVVAIGLGWWMENGRSSGDKKTDENSEQTQNDTKR